MIRSHEKRRWCSQCATKRFAIRLSLSPVACLSKPTLSCKTENVSRTLDTAPLVDFPFPPFGANRHKIGRFVGVHNRPNDTQLLTSNKGPTDPTKRALPSLIRNHHLVIAS